MRRLVGTTALDIMIVQFRNERVSNRPHTPLTATLWPSSLLKSVPIKHKVQPVTPIVQFTRNIFGNPFTLSGVVSCPRVLEQVSVRL
ncbi:hypothetical protein TNCV_1048791 [Trichonephila clavipes]|nr:hypothetical protein TNCV_1048791 [Trichonephila clavipes]